MASVVLSCPQLENFMSQSDLRTKMFRIPNVTSGISLFSHLGSDFSLCNVEKGPKWPFGGHFDFETFRRGKRPFLALMRAVRGGQACVARSLVFPSVKAQEYFKMTLVGVVVLLYNARFESI